jgi:hypothetical protein
MIDTSNFDWIKTATRETMIEWLCANDPNGCYTDEDAEAECFEPLTLNGAVSLILLALAASE